MKYREAPLILKKQLKKISKQLGILAVKVPRKSGKKNDYDIKIGSTTGFTKEQVDKIHAYLETYGGE